MKFFSFLPPFPQSVNRVKEFLAFWDQKKKRCLYTLLNKSSKPDVAKYDALKECSLGFKDSRGVLNFKMPRIGCVDDFLEWVNRAIC